MGAEAVVAAIPDCDICKQNGRTEPALYDAKTWMGPWANMCQEHFDRLGEGGLGTGYGQRLVLRGSEDPEVEKQPINCTDCEEHRCIACDSPATQMVGISESCTLHPACDRHSDADLIEAMEVMGGGQQAAAD